MVQCCDIYRVLGNLCRVVSLCSFGYCGGQCCHQLNELQLLGGAECFSHIGCERLCLDVLLFQLLDNGAYTRVCVLNVVYGVLAGVGYSQIKVEIEL